jgi:gluconate 5-dehydrogenase
MHYSGEDNNLLKQMSLDKKVALVIGGSGYLGSQMSRALAELGANVIVASRNLDSNEDFAQELNSSFPNCKSIGAEVDITSDLSVTELTQFVSSIYPDGIDILVNCGWSGRKNNFESISMEDWNYDIEVCLTGVFRVIKNFVPLLKNKKGNIVNIASMYGHVAPDYRIYDSERFANPPSYGAAKAGVIQLTKYLASFLAPYGIRANCISPGPFPFPETHKENPEFIGKLGAKTPTNRVGRPKEIMGAVGLVCSEAGSYINGQNICVDGGWSVW